MRTAHLLRRVRNSLSARTAILLAASIAAVVLFVEIAESVLQREADALDRSVGLWLHRFDSPAADVIMRVFTFLGSVPAIVGVVSLIAAWSLRSHARHLAGVLLAATAVAEGLNLLLKSAFQRARPGLFTEIAAPESYSFPSGHAMVAAAVYGMSAVVVARLRPALRLPLYLITPLLIVFIGTSRVFLGVHWPTDVLAGFAAGALVLVAGRLALGRARPARANRGS